MYILTARESVFAMRLKLSRDGWSKIINNKARLSWRPWINNLFVEREETGN